MVGSLLKILILIQIVCESTQTQEQENTEGQEDNQFTEISQTYNQTQLGWEYTQQYWEQQTKQQGQQQDTQLDQDEGYLQIQDQTQNNQQINEVYLDQWAQLSQQNEQLDLSQSQQQAQGNYEQQQQDSYKQQQISQINELYSFVPEKSPQDIRKYQAVILTNSIKLLLINNQYMTTSACSISLPIGSMNDPDHSLGLAHFLQHMLFMGSQNYPGQSQFSQFIKQNSGLRNAYTTPVETNFFFDIDKKAFIQALQRLADFFIHPLINQGSIDKQKQAVQNQYNILAGDDGRRRWQILKQLGNPPYSRFSAGNSQTLSYETVREDLFKFYENYYSSNIMSVVIFSNYSIEEMKSRMIPILEQIPNRNIQLEQLGQHFSKQHLGTLIKVKSIKDQYIMQIVWVVEQIQELYSSHINQYVNNILRNEGKNSLASYLREKNYIIQLTASVSHLKTQSLMFLQMRLTQQGKDNYEQIYNRVMDYVMSIQCKEQIYEQLKQKNQIEFEFREKVKPISYVQQLSSKMHSIKFSQILNFTVVFEQFQVAAQSISRVLSSMNEQNVIVILSSVDQLDDPNLQPYFGIQYQVFGLPIRQNYDTNFGQFVKNQYLPINTELVQFQEVTDTPVLIRQRIYLLQDSSYLSSKGGIQLRVFNQQDFYFLEFYAHYLELLLKEITYPAQILYSKIKITSDGALELSVFGFTQIVVKLFKTMSEQIKSIHSSEKGEIFYKVALNDIIQTNKNNQNLRLQIIAENMLEVILTQNLVTFDQVIQNYENYQYLTSSQRINNTWDKNMLQWVVVGNFDQQTIIDLIDNVQQQIGGDNQEGPQIIQYGCLRVQQNLIFELQLESEDIRSSCTIVYFQAGQYSQDLNYKLNMLKQCISQSYFTQLRTNKKLAYLLNVKVDNTRGVLGLRFILISSTHDPKQISDQIKQFVFNFFGSLNQRLQDQNSEMFNILKTNIFKQSKATLGSLQFLFQATAQQINQRTYYFTRKQQEQINKYLDQISPDDLEQTWESMKENIVQIYIISSAHKQSYEEHGIQANDISQIKQQGEYYNDAYYCCD